MSVLSNSIADNCCYFSGCYDRVNDSAILELERLTLGCDYGGSSWATHDEADNIINNLKLTKKSHLLDIGAGCGWPALYLCSKTGCRVTLVDLPENAIKRAKRRAQQDKIESKVNCIQGSGANLPITDGTYDRLNHSDVLCCLPEKSEMLKECRRVSTDKALMHFSVILPTTGLSRRDEKRALDNGPPHIEASDSYDNLLNEAGWQVRTCLDVTKKFNGNLKSLNLGLIKHKEQLLVTYGKEEYAEQVAQRQIEQELTQLRHIQRVIYVAEAD